MPTQARFRRRMLRLARASVCGDLFGHRLTGQMSRRHDFSPHLVNLAVVREMEHAHLRRKSIPHSDYLFRTATHWRMRAEKMRALAEETHDSTVRAMMLRFAANYDRVAGQAVDPAQHNHGTAFADLPCVGLFASDARGLGLRAIGEHMPQLRQRRTSP
jgi:hypothetical protein